MHFESSSHPILSMSQKDKEKIIGPQSDRAGIFDAHLAPGE
jgi:hypothetical protein